MDRILHSHKKEHLVFRLLDGGCGALATLFYPVLWTVHHVEEEVSRRTFPDIYDPLFWKAYHAWTPLAIQNLFAECYSGKQEFDPWAYYETHLARGAIRDTPAS